LAGDIHKHPSSAQITSVPKRFIDGFPLGHSDARHLTEFDVNP